MQHAVERKGNWIFKQVFQSILSFMRWQGRWNPRLGSSPSFPLYLAYWDPKIGRIMKPRLPRLRASSPLSIQEIIRPQQESGPGEESYPSTLWSLFVKVSVPPPGIPWMTPTLEVQQAWWSQKTDTWNEFLQHKHVSCAERPMLPGCSKLLSSPPGTKQCVRSECRHLAWAFLGEALASAVNRTGAHWVRLAVSGQMWRDNVGPTTLL